MEAANDVAASSVIYVHVRLHNPQQLRNRVLLWVVAYKTSLVQPFSFAAVAKKVVVNVLNRIIRNKDAADLFVKLFKAYPIHA